VPGVKRDARTGESLERLEMLYLTAGEIAHSVDQPVPVVMRLAIGRADKRRLPVDDILRDWLAATLD
jgi:hypothetical protein